MEIKSAEFLRSMSLEYFNENTPEIAVVGKSNVGKSSLINMLTAGKYARVSKQPGRTRLVNYFNIRCSVDILPPLPIPKGVSEEYASEFVSKERQTVNEFYLVDLPGYGFARASKEEQAKWDEMMGVYFDAARPNLRVVLLLLDIRHPPGKADIAMLHYIEYHAIPYIIIATKSDKIAKSKRYQECQRLRRALPTSTEYTLLPVSAEQRLGKEQLLSSMAEFLEERN